MADRKRAPANGAGLLTRGLLALTITALPNRRRCRCAGIVNANITAQRGSARRASWTPMTWPARAGRCDQTTSGTKAGLRTCDGESNQQWSLP
jgi:hypothetical protein